MATNPLAWQEREYVDSNGTVERWHIEFIDGHAYNCKRIIFPSVEAMERALTATQRPLDLIDTEPGAAQKAVEQAAAEHSSRFGALHSAEAAIAFFADGRLQAAHAAHEIVAAVEDRSGN